MHLNIIFYKGEGMGSATLYLSTEIYKNMIIQYIDDASTYRKLNFDIDTKTCSNLRRFLKNAIKFLQNLNKKFRHLNFLETNNFLLLLVA